MPRAALTPDITLATAARLLGFGSADEFRPHLPVYLRRGFPAPDPITDRIDPEAFERWRRLRTPHLYPELTGGVAARDPAALAEQRRAARCASQGRPR